VFFPQKQPQGDEMGRTAGTLRPSKKALMQQQQLLQQQSEAQDLKQQEANC
jgi:hypothetical protein